ncbi:hypothetical protein GCM10010912_00690 [Paenibacillus albidus]|uniref:Uncharacterized protein n=1 Tax=Paenibacillus albidus TaxID=2041023 RepID=A0A917BWI7_9BACL|nr:hypothetical protein GCM10010912_00690 [Paenibacillus albidus]
MARSIPYLRVLSMLGITDYGAEDYAFSTYPESFMLIDTFVRATFIIFAGVLALNNDCRGIQKQYVERALYVSD